MDEESYDSGNFFRMKAILAHYPNQDQKALCGIASLKKKILTKQLHYFLRLSMSYYDWSNCFSKTNNEHHNHNVHHVQEETAGNNN